MEPFLQLLPVMVAWDAGRRARFVGALSVG